MVTDAATDALARALDMQDDRSYCHHNALGVGEALAALGYAVVPIEQPSPPKTWLEQVRELEQTEQAAEAADREVAEADGSLSTSAAADLDTLQTGPYSVDEQFRKAHPADPPCDCGVPWLHPSAAADPLDVEALMFWFRWALDALGPEPPGAGRLYASQYGEAEAAYAAAKEAK